MQSLRNCLIVGLVVFVVCGLVVDAKKSFGTVELDDENWNKVVDGSKTVFIEFAEFSWKGSTEFDNLGTEYLDNKDVLLVTVDVSESPNLKKKFDINQDEVHNNIYKLLPKGAKPEDALLFKGATTTADLNDFLSLHTYPKLAALKDLVKDFVDSAEKTTIVQKVEDSIKDLTTHEKGIANVILSHLKQIEAKGKAYIANEKTRLTGLLDSKTNEEKKNSIRRRLSALGLFEGPTTTTTAPKEEL